MHSASSVREKLDKFIRYLEKHSPWVGSGVKVEENTDYPLFDTLNGAELYTFKEYARSSGLIVVNPGSGNRGQLAAGPSFWLENSCQTVDLRFPSLGVYLPPRAKTLN